MLKYYRTLKKLNRKKLRKLWNKHYYKKLKKRREFKAQSLFLYEIRLKQGKNFKIFFSINNKY